MPVVTLRPVESEDLDEIFQQSRDPVAVRMAAFTPENPDDRSAFDAHMAKIMYAPGITLRAITQDGRLVGTISSFPSDGTTELTYWIARAYWGQGIASRALSLFLDLVAVRPLKARVASDNVRSLRVLQKAGFETIGTEVSYASGRGSDIEETILELRGVTS